MRLEPDPVRFDAAGLTRIEVEAIPPACCSWLDEGRLAQEKRTEQPAPKLDVRSVVAAGLTRVKGKQPTCG
jgi:hypothetical protein